MTTRTLCKHCGHEWETRSVRLYTTCPTCLYKVRVILRPDKSASARAIAPVSAPPKPPTLEDLRKILREQMPTLRERYGVLSLAVFGSRVREDYRRDSDLDLLVEFDDRSLSLLDFIGVELELSDLLGVKVDLVERRVLKPAIGQRILAEAVPV